MLKISIKNITTMHLKKFVKGLIDMMDKEGINSLSDLEQNIDGFFIIDEHSGEFVSIELAGAEGTARVYKVNYAHSKYGVPIVINVNKSEGYTSIILKSSKNVPGYAPLITDPYQNMLHIKTLPTADVSVVRDELEEIIKSFR